MKSILKSQIAFLFVIWLLFLCSDFSFAADTVSAKYFPLRVGNSYVYQYTDNFFQQFRRRATISKDSIINNKKYFYCSNFPGFPLASWVRYDSSKSNLLVYTGSNSCSNYSGEVIMDSLAMSVNNSINCYYNNISLRKCTAIGNQTYFGQSRQTKSFLHDGLIYSGLTYASGVGLVSYCSGEPPPCSGYFNLIGYVDANTVYGDTLLTGVENTYTIVPDKYFLAQNFPNPFNPETNISFSIPENSYVTIKVYDVLGKEIEELVSQNFTVGNYNIKWNAGNFSSGIYYYKISAGDFSFTRRMILAK